jgi:hypothetical protein
MTPSVIPRSWPVRGGLAGLAGYSTQSPDSVGYGVTAHGEDQRATAYVPLASFGLMATA